MHTHTNITQAGWMTSCDFDFFTMLNRVSKRVRKILYSLENNKESFLLKIFWFKEMLFQVVLIVQYHLWWKLTLHSVSAQTSGRTNETRWFIINSFGFVLHAHNFWSEMTATLIMSRWYVSLYSHYNALVNQQEFFPRNIVEFPLVLLSFRFIEF